MKKVKDLWFLLFAVLLGLAIRLNLLHEVAYTIDADEGIVGLMAKHITEGQPVPTFYYGQHYLGSFEAIFSSFFFYLFGESAAVLKIVPLLFSLALICAMYYIAKSLKDTTAGKFAALFTAVAPSMLVVWSTKARGGFIEIVFIGALALLFTIQWLKSPTLKGTCIIGLVLGLGWWINNQMIYFMLPIGLWMALKLGLDFKQQIKHIVSGLIAFIVGGAPFWIYNIQHDFVTFQMFGATDSSGVSKNIDNFFSVAMPIILGARRDWQKVDAFPYSDEIMWTLVGICCLVLIIVRRKELFKLLTLKIDTEHPLEIILCFILGVFFVFAYSSFGSFAVEPRYLLPIYVGTITISAVVASTLYNYRKLLGLTFGALVLALHSASLYWGGTDVPEEPLVFEGERVVRDSSEILNLLKEKDIHFIRTNYWIGYKLAFESHEDIKFITIDKPSTNRIPDYLDEFEPGKEAYIPLVLVPKQAEVVRLALDTLGYNFSEEKVKGYSLIYNIEREEKDLQPLDNLKLSAEASVMNDEVRYAFDGDLKTRWRSAEPQKKMMRFVLTLDEPRELRGLDYVLGEWAHDFPRALRIEIEAPNGEREVLIDPPSFWAVRFFGSKDYFFVFPKFLTKRIYFVQEGEDPVFDWSIAEIKLFK